MGLQLYFVLGTAEVFHIENRSTGSWLEHMPGACPREYLFNWI